MSGARGAGPPSPDGRHDDLLPEDLDGLTLHAPDDPSELAADRARWLAEEASGPRTPAGDGTWEQRRAARRRRLSLTAAVMAVSLLVVAISGAVGAWIVGPQAAPPGAAPLASAVPESGRVGGLLPDATLQDGSTDVSARSMRPAVLALLPRQCDECSAVLSALGPQVSSFGVPLIAVGAPEQSDQLADLVDTVGAARLATFTDADGTLSRAFAATDVTLLLVRNDGVVVDVVRDPTLTTHLEGTLVQLVPAGGSQT
jgi:hypothetical protein